MGELEAEPCEIQTRFKEKLFHHEKSQAGEQVAQRAHEVSILGDFKDRYMALRDLV